MTETTEQIVGLSRAKKLKELGFTQNAACTWWEEKDGSTVIEWPNGRKKPVADYIDPDGYSAFSVSELDHIIEELKRNKQFDGNPDDPRLKTHDNKANNRADILIELSGKEQL